jgi:multidrug efflux pump subunit AcrA (membrane-fusion protein)
MPDLPCALPRGAGASRPAHDGRRRFGAFNRVLCVIAPIILILGCSSSGGSGGRYETVRAQLQSFSPSVTALGTVKPQVGAEVRLGARISGRVERLNANIGEHVTRGQIVAELESAELRRTVEQEAAELDRVLSNLAGLEVVGPLEIRRAESDSGRLLARYELAVTEQERQAALFAENLTSQQSLDAATQQLAVAREELQAAITTLALTREQFAADLLERRAEVDAARAALRVAEVELSYATLRAPISGTIASVSTQEGETVAAGLSAPTFVTIIDLDRLQVETYVDETDIGRISVGQRAVFTVEAFPAEEIEGEVVAIYPKAILRENVVFYSVVVSAPASPPVPLRPEMTANVSLLLAPREDVLMVPVTAVRRSGGKNMVYVVDDGAVLAREVQIGWRSGRLIEITRGLHEGEEVLVSHTDAIEEVR